ncbi:hypothetical protein B9G39_10165 [Zooshikella ganghwensis]|uniref:Uncharacterized protein n=1 Tax=Zooshikella ganghwensis TaxID=202772 RepID=A0A4P9VLR6_9GAMM|nr:hypothetical protein B9G39_10165 [Zooshikella ganghwensis]
MGRRGSLNNAQRKSAPKCKQRWPAGLPFGIPGKEELIEGTIQQAPQPLRQFTQDLLQTYNPS